MSSRRRLTRTEARDALRSEDWLEAMRRLPDDVDLTLATKRVLELIDDGYWLHRFGSDLAPPVIDATLTRLRAKPDSAGKLLVLELSKHSLEWSEIAAILGSLDRSYGWGSKQMRAIFRGHARRPEVLAAIQTAVVGDAEAPVSFLAVLAADGSETSVDALMPVFAKADSNVHAALKTHAAKTTGIEAMFAALDAKSAARNKRSRATEAVGNIVGAPLEKVSLRAPLQANGIDYQGSVTIDSDSPQWWRVWLSTRGKTIAHFGEREMHTDSLKLGVPQFEELPAWLGRVEKKLGIQFEVRDPFMCSLRGKKRDAFRDWLFSR